MHPRPEATMPTPAPFEYRMQLPHDPRAVGVARRSLRAALMAHEVPELLERAELLASELLTNAIVHSDGEAQLRLRWARESLWLSVWDTNPKPPELRISDDDSEGGRGLHLLGTLADRWSHYPVRPDVCGGAESKIVWCRISRSAPG
ncbi:ATP-binding protein [Streptomyces xinghaiensis]|uniref:ATP-binding protein n=2 Tax=Streptomyces TaxID=1883 RepID=A0A3M8EX25_9ACTN|nr:ATP-binding protein [Streptomyces xinghaiensis]RKM91235.1 ATP-binding protein [Streptomyces xinghaiensis]RNC69728.1 ATP-binding protein [Streptomyces xinghaiensis]